MAIITAIISAIPEFIQLIHEIAQLAEKVSGNNPGAVISNISDAVKKVNTAKTLEEKQDAAKALANSIAHV